MKHLLQCANRSCGHVLWADEYEWIPNARRLGHRACCPKCLKDSFFTLNEKGIRMTMSERQLRIDGVKPEDISPSMTLGGRMKRRLLDAQTRALSK